LSPGDTVAAKIDAVLARASIVVVDVSTDWTRAELRIALSRLGATRVLVISDRPEALEYATALVRPSIPDLNDETFLKNVDAWFAARASKLQPTVEEEPERLLGLGLTRASVIAALTLLEVHLRKRLALTTRPTRPMGLGQLLQLAMAQSTIPDSDITFVKQWITIRNIAVHSPDPISAKEARRVVEGVRDLIQRMKQGR